MKFIVDENLEPSISNWLKNKGYDTFCVLQEATSIDDTTVLSIANKEERIIITNDKDFGELVFKNDLPCKGLVLLRLQDNSLIGRINALKNLFDNYFTLISQDNFIVASDENVRVKKFQ
jgi:predicted nuclease of predicted toxin-antitoxin system